MSTAVIAPLTDARDAAIVADWIWNEWARHEPGVTRADSDAGVQAALRGDRLPHFIVARVDGRPVGCASIVAADLPTRPDLGPWLANVYVVPAQRGHGLGSALVREAMAQGASIAGRLYLYTFGSTAWYARLGWRPHAAAEYAGRPISILSYDVAGARAPTP
ncbi:GNAT family N-acetyltransferase [Lysobacter xanthus]